MTYYVSSGTLNPTHSLNVIVCIVLFLFSFLLNTQTALKLLTGIRNRARSLRFINRADSHNSKLRTARPADVASNA